MQLISACKKRAVALFGTLAIASLVSISTIAGIPGSTGDTTADIVLGQVDFTHKMTNFGGPAALSGPSQVAADAAGHLYVADLLNNRVLGWKDVSKLASGTPADIVIGQPDAFSSSAGIGQGSLNFSACG